MVSVRPVVVERVADGGDAAVHHVAGGDDVGAALGVRDRHLGEQLEGDVVEHLTLLDHAAVPVVGVLAEAHVGDDHQFRELVLDGADGHLHDALVVVGAGGGGVLVRRDAEQQDRLDAEPDHLAHLGQHVADGELVAAGHRRDGVLDVLAGDDEQRVDEVVELQLRLAHQVPDGGGAAQAPHAVAGVVHAVVSFLRAGPGAARLGGQSSRRDARMTSAGRRWRGGAGRTRRRLRRRAARRPGPAPP